MVKGTYKKSEERNDATIALAAACRAFDAEEQSVNRIRKAKLCVFLRHHRYELLDETFQEELANLYREAKRGQPQWPQQCSPWR